MTTKKRTLSQWLSSNGFVQYAEMAQDLEQENKRLREIEEMLYHQRDLWKKRAEHPESAWSVYVDGNNALVLENYKLRKALEELREIFAQDPDDGAEKAIVVRALGD